MLESEDLFSIELAIRTEAERIRFRWPKEMLSDPSVPPDTKVHARGRRHFADRLDQVGNLLCGMQADWSTIGPMLRKGYLAMQLPEPKAVSVEEDAA